METQLDLKRVLIYLDEYSIFVSIPKEFIEKDRKFLNFIFNKFFSKVIASSFCVALLFPKPSFASYQKERKSNVQCTQIERTYESELSSGYRGLIIDFRPRASKSKSLSLIKQVDNLNLGFSKILKFKKPAKILNTLYNEEFTKEKINMPLTVRYNVLPIRIRAPQLPVRATQNFYHSSLVPISILQGSPQQLHGVKNILHLKGGFKILTFGVLVSKLMKFLEQKKEPETGASEITRLKNSRQEKLRLFCFAFISFIVLLLSIFFLFATRTKVDIQIVLNMQKKLEELYQSQLKLQEDVFQLSQNLLEISRLSQIAEENNFTALKSLSEKVKALKEQESLPVSVTSSRTIKSHFKAHFREYFHEYWTIQCKKTIFSLILSKEIPNISELFESLEENGMEEVIAFIETICKGDLRKKE